MRPANRSPPRYRRAPANKTIQIPCHARVPAASDRLNNGIFAALILPGRLVENARHVFGDSCPGKHGRHYIGRVILILHSARRRGSAANGGFVREIRSELCVRFIKKNMVIATCPVASLHRVLTRREFEPCTSLVLSAIGLEYSLATRKCSVHERGIGLWKYVIDCLSAERERELANRRRLNQY